MKSTSLILHRRSGLEASEQPQSRLWEQGRASLGTRQGPFAAGSGMNSGRRSQDPDEEQEGKMEGLTLTGGMQM